MIAVAYGFLFCPLVEMSLLRGLQPLTSQSSELQQSAVTPCRFSKWVTRCDGFCVCYRVLSCPGPPQSQKLPVSPGMSQSSSRRCGICCFHNLKRPTRSSTSFLRMGDVRSNKLSFILNEMSQSAKTP